MSSEAEWEDRVQSDVTTSTYSSSSEVELSGNETQDITEENTLKNSESCDPLDRPVTSSHAHVINILQPVCNTSYSA